MKKMNSSSLKQSNMDNYVENILAEVVASIRENLTLKRKLDSKCEALIILNKELSECIIEKDQYKVLAEQLQKKLSSYKKMPIKQTCFTECQEDNFLSVQDSKEVNRSSAFEVESLRQKLRDALGDIKALRSKLNQQKNAVENSSETLKQIDKEEELLKQLEAMNKVKTQLQLDLQAVLDEKEELITERDAYKCKIHRLNHEFNMLLKGENRNIIDLDSLIMENRYLQEHLQQAREEIKIANQTVNRYKGMFESRRSKGFIKIGIDDISETLLSQKQVQDLLQISSGDQITSNSVTASELRSICMALLENLSDKTLALVHQKKANRILASRICELEERLKTVEGSGAFTFPSQVLLDGYVGSDVDKNIVVRVSQESLSSRSEDNVRTGAPGEGADSDGKQTMSAEPQTKDLVQAATDGINVAGN